MLSSQPIDTFKSQIFRKLLKDNLYNKSNYVLLFRMSLSMSVFTVCDTGGVTTV